MTPKEAYDKLMDSEFGLWTDKTNYSAMFKVRRPYTLTIKSVIFNAPFATIVFWEDGTKTVVKCGYPDLYDPEKGLAMAIAKKALGNEGNYYNEFKKWLPEEKGELNK